MSKTQNDKELVTRYARALFAAAKKQDVLQAVEKDLQEVQHLLEQAPALTRLAQSPLLSRKQQGDGMVAALNKAGVSGLVAQFCRVLADNRRLSLLPLVIEAFWALLSEERNEAVVEVVSTTPLQEKQLAALAGALELSLGKKLRLKPVVDPGILGGLVIKIGSVMIDDSVRSKLERLKIVSKNAIASV